MITEEPRINLGALVLSLSKIMDLVSPAVANHQTRVANLAYHLAGELGLEERQQTEILIAGALHDCGALSLQERLGALQFETENPQRHAEMGYRLLKDFTPLSSMAELVRYHHTPWRRGEGTAVEGRPVPLGSHILHLADRLEVMLDKQEEILNQVEGLCRKMREHSGSMFCPEVVEALMNLAPRDFIWMDLLLFDRQDLTVKIKEDTLDLNWGGLEEAAKLFSRIVDFRSRFTATHTGGVAAVAEALARMSGFSQTDCRLIKTAGYLHDLGKLATSTEILEKPAPLNREEFNAVKHHVYYTYHILENFDNLKTINTWASYHHERPDGRGYPFHIKGDDLSLGSRIMAVADVFTALAEDRPYRRGMSLNKALEVLANMAANSALDLEVVKTLKAAAPEADNLRTVAQREELEKYRELYQN